MLGCFVSIISCICKFHLSKSLSWIFALELIVSIIGLVKFPCPCLKIIELLIFQVLGSYRRIFYLFITGYRNQSTIMVDMWLILVAGLLALSHSQCAILFVMSTTGSLLYFIINDVVCFQGVSWIIHVSLYFCNLL